MDHSIDPGTDGKEESERGGGGESAGDSIPVNRIGMGRWTST